MKQIMIFLWFALIINSCNQNNFSETQLLKAEIEVLKTKVEKMKPELGEIMGNIQAHHAKLYYSANSKNWKLSEFQLDEIKEGIEEATELHDHFKKVKASLKEISKVTIDPILQIDNAIKQKNVAQFTVAFNDLTRACNHCHQTAEHPFIAIQIPTSQMFSNQKFTTENPQ